MKDNNSYNVLIVGNKGREYALAQRLQQDERVNALYFCLGNGGTQDLGENLECEHYEHIVELALKKTDPFSYHFRRRAFGFRAYRDARKSGDFSVWGF